MSSQKVDSKITLVPYKTTRIFLVDLPDIDDEKKEAYIRLNMNAYYPGDPSDVGFRLRKIFESQHFLYLFHKEDEAGICGSSQSRSPVDVLIPYLADHDFLMTVCEDGYYALKKNEGVFSFKFWTKTAKNRKALHDELACMEKDSVFLAELGPEDGESADWALFPGLRRPEAEIVLIKSKTVFLSGGKSKKTSLLPAISIAFGAAGLIFLIVSFFLSRLSAVSRLQALVDQRKIVVAKVETMRKEIEELEGQVSLKDDQPAASAYRLLFYLAGALDDSTRLKTLIMDGNKFIAEAQAPDALAVVDQLTAHPGFSGIKITGITSLADKNMVKFTISGTYNGSL